MGGVGLEHFGEALDGEIGVAQLAFGHLGEADQQGHAPVGRDRGARAGGKVLTQYFGEVVPALGLGVESGEVVRGALVRGIDGQHLAPGVHGDLAAGQVALGVLGLEDQHPQALGGVVPGGFEGLVQNLLQAGPVGQIEIDANSGAVLSDRRTIEAIYKRGARFLSPT